MAKRSAENLARTDVLNFEDAILLNHNLKKSYDFIYIYIILCKYLLKNPVLYYFHEAVYSLNVLCFSIFGGDRCQKILILLYHRSGKEPPKRIYFR